MLLKIMKQKKQSYLIENDIRNADEMAETFNSINHLYYNRKMLQEMLYEHLAFTTDEVKARHLRGTYSMDIEEFDKVEKAVLIMARYFTNGILEQFAGLF